MIQSDKPIFIIHSNSIKLEDGSKIYNGMCEIVNDGWDIDNDIISESYHLFLSGHRVEIVNYENV